MVSYKAECEKLKEELEEWKEVCRRLSCDVKYYKRDAEISQEAMREMMEYITQAPPPNTP